MIVVRIPSKQEEPFEQVAEELTAICEKLFHYLPDKTLSPLERLERLARVVPDSTLQADHHKSGRSKLNALRYRLAELVPDESMTSAEKIEYLVERCHHLVPEDMDKLFLKLEKLGDQRRSDIGR